VKTVLECAQMRLKALNDYRIGVVAKIKEVAHKEMLLTCRGTCLWLLSRFLCSVVART